MPGRSNAEEGKGEKDEEDEVRRMEQEVTNAVLTANLVDSTTSGVVAGEVEEMVNVERGCGGVAAERLVQHVNQSWDCSLVGNGLEERCGGEAMEEEVSKEEEKITVKRGEGRE